MLGFFLFCIYIGVLSAFAAPGPSRHENWWVEIVTDLPRCTYYFGPFDTDKEASSYTPGYLEDLESEGSKRLSVRIKRCQPSEVTICQDEFSEGMAA
ncbi:DUF1816 domain-containing protein [Microcoleus sp. LEGE 07076]|uniref:DUF1816 domain-containing protein n=1 Tax=Microcoleus sp. LEGE 07076 TaxID=915322 RepID=UPI00187E6076|nr:DUF1816 domain-containing protein [Microcoleus sp. LEGE 07076]MBE9187320.1 DUF1816 domain-containing protein [Microcoleus sp. LEGE 07076]